MWKQKCCSEIWSGKLNHPQSPALRKRIKRFSGRFWDSVGLGGCVSVPETGQGVYHGKGRFMLPEGLLGVHRAGLQGKHLFSISCIPCPCRHQSLRLWGEKCRKCHSSLGNFILTVPINGEVLNWSYFHREPKSSGCLFISLSLIKPNCSLKIVLLPYASQQGMAQQSGNENGE